MKVSEIKNVLKEFRKISPSEEFSQGLKMKLLQLEKQSLPVAKLMNVRMVYNNGNDFEYTGIFSRTIKVPHLINTFAFAVASLLILFGVYQTIQEISPLFLPGLNQKGITAEADMVEKQIDIQLSQIQYFKDTTKESSQALTQVTQTKLDHLNETLIQSEVSSINNEESIIQPAYGEKEIDKEIQNILQEVIK